MWSLKVTNLTSAQLNKLSHKLPNYSMVNYDLLKDIIQQFDENYPFSMSTWLTGLIRVLGSLLATTSTFIYCYFKHRRTKNMPKTFSLYNIKMT